MCPRNRVNSTLEAIRAWLRWRGDEAGSARVCGAEGRHRDATATRSRCHPAGLREARGGGGASRVLSARPASNVRLHVARPGRGPSDGGRPGGPCVTQHDEEIRPKGREGEARGGRSHYRPVHWSAPLKEGAQTPSQSNARSKMRSRLLALFLLSVLGCGIRMAPIHNVPASSVPPGLTQDEVHDAIWRAAAGRGWIVEEDSPGKVVARIDLRDHTAAVDIDYTEQRYSITYRESQNLDYDGTRIHKNYNGWITNLDRDIQRELFRRPPGPAH